MITYYVNPISSRIVRIDTNKIFVDLLFLNHDSTILNKISYLDDDTVGLKKVTRDEANIILNGLLPDDL